VSGSGISWAICKSAPRCRPITTPAPHRSVFYRPDALPATQPTASKHWRHIAQLDGIIWNRIIDVFFVTVHTFQSIFNLWEVIEYIADTSAAKTWYQSSADICGCLLLGQLWMWTVFVWLRTPKYLRLYISDKEVLDQNMTVEEYPFLSTHCSCTPFITACCLWNSRSSVS